MKKDEKKSKPATEEVPGEADSMISELKSAYKSIIRLRNSSGHRKISLEIERKIRRKPKD